MNLINMKYGPFYRGGARGMGGEQQHRGAEQSDAHHTTARQVLTAVSAPPTSRSGGRRLAALP
jgi:hypothetical protein